jgi:DNA mismatch repair protein MutS
MKAIGICIIMAQSGLYVPAEKCTISCYHTFFTRITSDDDIYNGVSSFTKEMLELKTIISRCDSKTIVIGDEVCRGTEYVSANSIVASTLVTLSANDTSFIFASHLLHSLSSITFIQKLVNIKWYHLSVEYDAKTDVLVYDRKLKEGLEEKVYGIIVSKYIVKNKSFNELCSSIKNELLGQNTSDIIQDKRSKYNSKLFVDSCFMCGSTNELHTHHLNYQVDCPNGFVNNKQHIRVNDMCNLIVLCEKCHVKIHQDNIKFNLVLTSDGKKLVVS